MDGVLIYDVAIDTTKQGGEGSAGPLPEKFSGMWDGKFKYIM